MSTKDQHTDFDFDQWVRLAREDPERFEQLRQQKIAEMIAEVPEEIRKRMEGLQWKIDQMRQTASNPMASCIRISSLMWDTVLGEDGLVQSIESLDQAPSDGQRKEREPAKIIDFGRSHGSGD